METLRGQRCSSLSLTRILQYVVCVYHIHGLLVQATKHPSQALVDIIVTGDTEWATVHFPYYRILYRALNGTLQSAMANDYLSKFGSITTAYKLTYLGDKLLNWRADRIIFISN